jgi:hypothetical protein
MTPRRLIRTAPTDALTRFLDRERAAAERSYVYFAECGGFVKIGS